MTEPIEDRSNDQQGVISTTTCTKEKIMRTSDLFKLVPVAAIALSLSTNAVAGATNRDENTAATPGEKATTTKTPADADAGRESMRRGTTNTGDMKTPNSAQDLERPGSGSAGSTGAEDKSMQHDKSSADPDASMSGSSGGAGDFGNAGGWDPNNPGEYPVTVR
jgi:hypothetical protein